MFTSNEIAEVMPLQGSNPRENALSDLRKICRGLLDDFGSINIGMSLHSLVERKRDECFKLGNTVQSVNEVIDNHRQVA